MGGSEARMGSIARRKRKDGRHRTSRPLLQRGDREPSPARPVRSGSVKESDDGRCDRSRSAALYAEMQARFRETVDLLREDLRKVEDPQLKAMFETAAEVLVGLGKALGDYEKKNEAAWR